VVKRTNNGVQTGLDGRSRYQGKNRTYLSLPFLGMTDTNKTVGAASTINVTLSSSSQSLNEVVITSFE
jgi:hypothetical protein